MQIYNPSFPHNIDARNSEKLAKLREQYGAVGYAAYFMLLEKLAETDTKTLTMHQTNLSKELGIDKETLKAVVNDFDLFVVIRCMRMFYSPYLHDYYKLNIPEQMEDASYQRWQSEKRNLRRRERRRAARARGRHTKRQWVQMLQFFGNKCIYCGATENIVKSRVIPHCRGGSDSINNIQPLCLKCSKRISNDGSDYRITFCRIHNLKLPDFSAVLGLAMRRHDTKQAEIPQYKDYTDLELSPEYEQKEVDYLN
ncbi:MAG: DUF4373 domain-containing protein [Bacteroidales bacterium]|nr:DUF4373 domain-containing protein [Bacteroidales bacterium]